MTARASLKALCIFGACAVRIGARGTGVVVGLAKASGSSPRCHSATKLSLVQGRREFPAPATPVRCGLNADPVGVVSTAGLGHQSARYARPLVTTSGLRLRISNGPHDKVLRVEATLPWGRLNEYWHDRGPLAYNIQAASPASLPLYSSISSTESSIVSLGLIPQPTTRKCQPCCPPSSAPYSRSLPSSQPSCLFLDPSTLQAILTTSTASLAQIRLSPKVSHPWSHTRAITHPYLQVPMASH